MSKDSTHQNRVTVIPANPEAVKEAQKRKERRDAASEELIHLQHRLLSASIQLEEDDMTDLEKLEVIGKLPASMDYNSDHWDYIEMFAYNTGNCAGSATMLVEMCRRLGIRAWVRNAKRDPDAGSAHVNALAEVDGAYYELEAGFQGKAPRSYKITKRTSLCKYKDAADGIDVYQYDGIDESDTVLTIPDSIDGKTVTRIGDGFLTENPWVRAVTIPDAVTEIDESAFPSYQGVLFGAKGSATEHFAATHGIRFGVTGSLEPEDMNF